jgi:iron complex outermembrane receptor protein
LIPSVIEAEEIVITGTRTERKLEDVPLRLELVNSKTFTEIPAIDLTGYLKQVPGVGVFNPGGFISHRNNVLMRGMSGVDQARVLVLLDGVPVNKADGGSVHWNIFQPEQIQRVEITKGPGSSLYGGNALGGVINIISRVPQNRTQGFVKAEYASLNTYGARFNISGSNTANDDKGLYYSLNGYYRQSDGYVNLALEDEYGAYIPKPDTASTTINNTMEEYGVDIKSGYSFNSENRVDISLSYYNDKRGTGYKYYEPVGSSNDHDTYAATINYNGVVGKTILNASGWIRNEDYQKVNDSDNSSRYYTVKSKRRDLGFQFNGTMPTGDIATLTAGFDIKRGSVDAVDDYQMVSDMVFNMGQMTSFALFAQEEVTAFEDKLLFIAGVRLDHARYHNGAFYIEDATSATTILQDLEDRNQDEHTWNAISPRLSLQYKITPDIRVYSTFSNGFRPSVLDDLCRSGFVRGGFKKANPLLEPEKINSFEIGGDLHMSKLTLSPSLYYSRGTNFMYYVSTGDSIQQGSRLRPVRQVENIGEIEIKGFEIKITLDLLSNLSAYLNYNYNESVITEFDPLYSDQSEDITGMYLTYVPKNQLSAGMGWRNRVVNAGMALNHIGSYFSDDLNSTVIDPFTTLDVRLWRSFDKIGVKLDIENILNRVDLVDDGTINFGRFTRLELSWSF